LPQNINPYDNRDWKYAWYKVRTVSNPDTLHYILCLITQFLPSPGLPLIYRDRRGVIAGICLMKALSPLCDSTSSISVVTDGIILKENTSIKAAV
jgi:hypothetical protein